MPSNSASLALLANSSNFPTRFSISSIVSAFGFSEGKKSDRRLLESPISDGAIDGNPVILGEVSLPPWTA